ncbi:uncharacterized protein L201_001063 [Kwoniella dendrophila CBS 6074]|uniref:Protein kinase domain-containing protein n=1 Tax=Kwoniella dendrophila CBS 6074 TaxID=1295534 RepID=A0AAX4JNS7_9TREE
MTPLLPPEDMYQLTSTPVKPEWLLKATQVKVECGDDFEPIFNHTMLIKTPLMQFPLTNHSTPDIEVTIKLGKPRGSGYLWDVYEAIVYNPDTGDSLEVVVKYTLPFTFEGLKYHDDWLCDDQTLEGIAIDAIETEHRMYTKDLLELQGKDIPIHYGTFADQRKKAFCMILEDVGDPIGNLPAMWNIDEADKIRIKEIFESIHKLNILHWTVERDNVCKREKDGAIRVIDFHRAARTDSALDLAWEQHEAEINVGLATWIMYADFVEDFHEAAAKIKNNAEQDNASVEPDQSNKRKRKHSDAKL